MRIVIVNDFSVARGGATGLALRSAELLAGRGHEVILVCGDSGSSSPLLEKGIRVIGLGSKPLLKRDPVSALVDGLYHRKAATHLSESIQALDGTQTIYHLHGWSKILSPAVFAALRPVKERLVVHAHDFFLGCPNGGFWNFPKQENCNLSPLGAACVLTNCDRRSYAHKLWRTARAGALMKTIGRTESLPAVLLIHPLMEEPFIRAGYHAECLRVVRNPATAYLHHPAAPEHNRKFVYIGRLDAEKGVLQFARAARHAGVPALFIGEGPLEQAVRHEYPSAEFVGWQDRAGLARYAAQARALVMPSLYPEPFGLVAAEALASGLPVLLARSALLSAEVVDGSAGMTINPQDVDAFAAVLRKLRDDDELVAAMARAAVAAGRRVALTDEAWCSSLESVYRRLLTAPHTTSTLQHANKTHWTS